MRRHAKAIGAASALLLLTMALGVNLATATAPTVSIDAPSSVSYTSVHVSGKVNPEDQETSYYFQYSTEPGNEFNWQSGAYQGPLAANSGEANASDDLSGLSPGTEYFVRLVAESADGQTISAEPHPSFTTDAVAPAAVSIDAPSSITGDGAHFSGRIDPEAPGGNPAAFDVNWSFQCTPACPGLSGSIPADSSNHTVEADATGLKPGTAYEVTLVATNAGGSASTGSEGFTTATVAPQVKGQISLPLVTEATLQAQINPGGLATNYHFEYGLTASYGQSTALKGLSAGGVPVVATASISGLTGAATYHYRVVASNSLGTVEGGDRTFTTSSVTDESVNCPNESIRLAQNATGLPECRAFEMVSPLYKNGGDVQLLANRASVNGDAVVFQARTGFANGQGNARINEYHSKRGSNGWKTQSLTPYLTPPTSFFEPANGYEDFTPDLSGSVMLSLTPPFERQPDIDENENRLYYRSPSGEYHSISPKASEPPFFPTLQYAGASRDMRHVFFESDRHFTPDSPPIFTNELYEWSEGQLAVVGVLPNGEVAADGASLPRNRTTPHAGISPDGSQAVFASGFPSQLYLRQEGVTSQITLSQRAGSVGDPAPNGAEFAGSATADGKKLSKLYFISPDPLTDESNQGTGGEGGDLYEYDVPTGDLTDLTVTDDPVVNPAGADVNYYATWPLRGAVDGSYLYFTAAGALVPGVPGAPESIYVLHDGEIAYVGPMGASFDPAPIISADGRKGLFFTKLPFGNIDPNGHTVAVLYDAPTGSYTCISCPQGRPVSADATAVGFSGGAVGFPGFPYITRNFNANGNRVFFETGESLTPRDTNGQADVYMWEAGALKLLSSGQGAEGAHFVDASASGDDVFIGTREQLVATDIDANLDIYDVRVNGGFDPPEIPGAPCEGDACQSPVVAPNDATPASSSFHAAGNLKQKHRKAKQRKKKQKGKKQKGKKQQSKSTTRNHG